VAASIASPTARSTGPSLAALVVQQRAGGGKLAAATAGRIVNDIVSAGWPVGEALGSEGDLLRRYGVSRAVLREAVRIVEHQQVAHMRRGPGGGLVVAEPTVVTVSDAVFVHLSRRRLPLDELFEGRLVLEELVAERAPRRANEADMASLRELLAREADGTVHDQRELHALLARITGNPALDLFVDVFNRIARVDLHDVRAVPADVVREARHAHARIVEAVLAGNEGLARHRMRVHLEAEVAWLKRGRRSGGVVRPDPADLGRPHKRGEAVSREILRDILADGWHVGALIGSETELMDRHRVSRAVLREAVRLLEHHGVAAMRRGPGGGLFVAEPNATAVTEAAALYLERRGIAAPDLLEMRIGVELALVELATARIDGAGAAALEQALADERTVPDVHIETFGHALHREIAVLAANRPLQLVADVLLRLTRHHLDAAPRRRADRRRALDAGRRSHAGVVEAIVSGDVQVARHRMRRHLEALSQFLH
jgi:DNA-binding FadR family transcriptional regulator